MNIDLVGVVEIANRSGVPAAKVTTWFTLPGFPEPVANLASGSIWVWGPVHAWLVAEHYQTRADLQTY